MPKKGGSQKKKPVVFVGLSGGVDSSVSAYLLKKKGYEVVGVYMKTWQPDWIPCTWRDEKRDAMRVAATLDIPFVFLDVAKEYEAMVTTDMLSEYRAGRTPNPDVLCNREIKFGIFLRHALDSGADYIATGHYARIKKLPTTNYQLLIGADPTKDQSYFLWTLGQKELSKTLFPVGELTKKEVRAIAVKAGLPTAEKKDSQGICFIGPVDMKTFLSHYLPSAPGTVLDTKGAIIGTHDGAIFYTIGERHGFTISKQSTLELPYYVIEKNIEKNTITVSHTNPLTMIAATKKITLREINFCSTIPQEDKRYTAQIRYHGEYFPVRLKFNEDTLEVFFEEGSSAVASGQSLVLYDRGVCLGGGIIQ